MKLSRSALFLALAAIIASATTNAADKSPSKVTLLNASYDPTRELYSAINPLFAAKWKAEHNQTVEINQSHGGSGKQARAVIDGLEADVVTLALEPDIDALHANGNLVSSDWRSQFAENSAPYTSTIVFVVRNGNPRNIKDWPDVIKDGIEVITPNPKTSGGARWNYLAAWGYALKANNNDQAKAREFVTRLYKNVPILDTGARGSTNTFVQRELGDVFLSWENEAHLILKEFGADKYEIVTPSVSILAEPPVAIVNKVVDKRGTRDVAHAYLQFLYTPEAQEVIAKNFYRPRNKDVAARHIATFPQIPLFTVDELFGGWDKAQKEHFEEDGIFDQIIADTN